MAGGITYIGSYRIVRKLGEGGMGAVYMGEHRLLGRKAAIKVLLPSLSANVEVVKRFFNEARAVTRISDPGIVQVYDFGQHKSGSAYIVMELLRGEPMDRRLRRIERFTPAECIRLMVQICTSLDVVHKSGIVHRDLKPENLFLCLDPAVPGGERAKILDFGIAKLSGDDPGTHKTRTGVLMGTPYYMSPEQCSGGDEVDHRSDIYAMGCVMFAMLTGRPPFEGKGAGDLIAHHLREPAPRASSRVAGVPAALDDIVRTCLEKAPGDRFASMAQLVRALLAAERALGEPTVIDGEPVLGPGWDFHDRDVRPSRLTTFDHASLLGLDVRAPRRRLPWLAGGIGVITALSLIALRVGHAEPAPPPTAPVIAPAPAQVCELSSDDEAVEIDRGN
jgi:serine/threonine protein kinase